jgi:hypothetical protein
MQGRTEEAIAGCDRLIALAATEPDRFIRAVALGHGLAVLATCGALDRLEELQAEVITLGEELHNQYLRNTVASGLAPIIHVTDPDGAGEFLRTAYEQAEAVGFLTNLPMLAMFVALHELRSGNDGAAARWDSRALQAASDHGLSYVAATVNSIIAISKRHSAADATILLGALRAHRARKQQAGTQFEIDAESRYEASLRRKLGTGFDALYAKGAALDEAAMITSAFNQLDAIIECTDEPTETDPHLEVPR